MSAFEKTAFEKNLCFKFISLKPLHMECCLMLLFIHLNHIRRMSLAAWLACWPVASERKQAFCPSKGLSVVISLMLKEEALLCLACQNGSGMGFNSGTLTFISPLSFSHAVILHFCCGFKKTVSFNTLHTCAVHFWKSILLTSTP